MMAHVRPDCSNASCIEGILEREGVASASISRWAAALLAGSAG